VHVSPVPLQDFASYLDAIGWPGDAARVEALARLLLFARRRDEFTLAVLCTGRGDATHRSASE
jgi:hypothetical protein